jgi:iron(III) transport system permease protein
MKKSSNQNIKKLSTNMSPQSGWRLQGAIQILLFLLVGLFIIYPFFMIVLRTFLQEGRLSFDGYKIVFSNPATYQAIKNTLLLGGGVWIGTMGIGGVLAFVRECTDFPYKRSLDTLVFISFTIPSYILSISWLEIISRGGYLHRLIRILFPGVQYSVQAYSLAAATLVLILHLYPLVYFGVSNMLKKLDPALIRNAQICGAKMPQIFRSILLPLMIPALVSTGLLVMSRAMANFGVVAQLALPIGAEVLTTRIFSALSDLNLPSVSVYSLILIAFSLLFFALTEKKIKRNQYQMNAVDPNKSSSLLTLGKGKKAVTIAVFAFFFITLGLPISTIVLSSFLKRWGVALKLENLTLHNYSLLFSGEKLLVDPLRNSLVYGATAAIIASLLASLIVYFYLSTPNRKVRWLMQAAQLPIGFPNMILGISAMLAWIHKPLQLYGTGSILIVTYAVLFLPICIRQIHATVKAQDPHPDHAAQTMGIPMIHRFIRLFLPSIRNSLISGFLICFLISLREIPISLLLYTAGTKTLGVLLFTIQSNSYGLEMTSTIAVIVIGISLLGNLLLQKNKKGDNKYESSSHS